jgi:hypothetical protein
MVAFGAIAFLQESVIRANECKEFQLSQLHGARQVHAAGNMQQQPAATQCAAEINEPIKGMCKGKPTPNSRC